MSADLTSAQTTDLTSTDSITSVPTTTADPTTSDSSTETTTAPTSTEPSPTATSSDQSTITPNEPIPIDSSTSVVPTSTTTDVTATATATDLPTSSSAAVRFFEPSTNLSFALTNVENGTENSLYMRLQIPTKYGWGAVGIGSEMAGATIFVIYPSTEPNGTTLSVRTAGGHYEPEVDTQVACVQQTIPVVEGGYIDAGFICPNGNDERLTSDPAAADWIWAAGPEIEINSDANNATIEMHQTSGFFQLNMTEAKLVVDPTATDLIVPLPALSAVDQGVSDAYTEIPPNGFLVDAHAILLAGSFLVLFPLGVLLLRWRSNIRFHWYVQLFATGCCILGLFLALIMSALATRFQEFDHFHQIIGIISVLALVPQAAIGYWHHKQYKEVGMGAWMSVPHINLGRAAMILGLVAGASGFALAGSTWSAIAYAAAGLAVLCGLTVFIVRNKRVKKRREGERVMMANLGVKDGEPATTYA